MKRKLLFLGISASVLVSLVSFALAQVQFTGDFSVNLTPEAPGPNEQVSATAVSYSFDISRAKIQWILNRKSIASGPGLKTVSFQVGSAGSLSTLDVLISPETGGNYRKTIEIRPLSIDLLVEASSYIPPWYKGAALASPASQIKIIALPNFIFEGVRLDPAGLVYNWKLNDTVRGDLSGKGKWVLNYKMPAAAGTQARFSVVVSSPKETLESSAATAIETQSPEVLFYERRSTEGIITSRTFIDTTVKTGSSVDIEAVPFFLNASDLDAISFAWSFEGKKVSKSSDLPNILTIKTAPAEADSVASVVATSIKNALSTVNASFNIHAR